CPMSNPMLDAALSYAQRGWWVFPCQERGKLPYGKTTGSHMATRNPTLIRAMWGATCWPNANIALATGARFGPLGPPDAEGRRPQLGMVAFDFDRKPDKVTGEIVDGTTYYFEHEELFPPTCMNMSSNGGFHLI